jgi:hypothetical protein
MSSSTVVTDQDYNHQINREAAKFNPWTMSCALSSSFSSESYENQINGNIDRRSMQAPVSLPEGTIESSSNAWVHPASTPSVNLMNNTSAFDPNVITSAVDSLNLGMNSTASSFFPSSVTHSTAYFPQNSSFSGNPGAGRPITASQSAFNRTPSAGGWTDPDVPFNSYTMERNGFPLQGIVNHRPVSPFHESRSIFPRAVGAKNSYEAGLRRPNPINAFDSFNGQRPPSMSNMYPRGLFFRHLLLLSLSLILRETIFTTKDLSLFDRKADSHK